jgi:hypothetical protein
MGMNGRYFTIRKSALHVAQMIFVWITASIKTGKSLTFKMILGYNCERIMP